jgi:hypothetical protein
MDKYHKMKISQQNKKFHNKKSKLHLHHQWEVENHHHQCQGKKLVRELRIIDMREISFKEEML